MSSWSTIRNKNVSAEDIRLYEKVTHIPLKLHSTPCSMYLPVSAEPNPVSEGAMWGGVCVWQPRAWGIGFGLSFPMWLLSISGTWAGVGCCLPSPFPFQRCLTSVWLHMGWMIDAGTHTRKHIRSHLPPFSTLPSFAIILSVTGTPVGIKTKALRGRNWNCFR